MIKPIESILILCFSAIIFFLFYINDSFELLIDWSRQHEGYEIDELILLIPVIAIASIYILLRNLIHFKKLNIRLTDQSDKREKAEKELSGFAQKLESKVEVQTNRLKAINRAQTVLIKCIQSTVHAKNELDLLNDLCKILVEEGDYKLAWIGYALDDKEKTVKTMAQCGVDDHYIDKAKIVWADSERGQGPVGISIRTGERAICRDIKSDPKFKLWRDDAIERGYASIISLPLMTSHHCFGALTIYSTRTDAFDEDESKLLEEMSQTLAYGIMNLKTQIKLINSEQKFRKIFEGSPEGIVLVDLKTKRFIYVNPALCDFLGYSQTELTNMEMENVHPKEDLPFVISEFEAQARKEKILAEKIPCLRKDGTVCYADIKTTPSLIDGKECNIGFFTDVTERQLFEASQKNQLEFLQTLIETMPNPVFYKNTEGAYLGCNEAFENYIGLEKENLIGKSVYDIAPIELAEIYDKADRELCNNPGVQIYEANVKYADGSLHDVVFNKATYRDANGLVAGLVGVMIDISELKKSEHEKRTLLSQLQQAQKMESLGNLAGGIAHDFNNILSSIIGFTQLGLDEAKKGSNLEDYLQEIFQAGKRTKDLVKQILAFARQSDEKLQPIQVKTIVHEVLKLLRSTIPSTIEIKTNVESESIIIGNSSQLHQVLMNILTNAAHAMEENGGLLEVSLEDVIFDNPYEKNNLDLKKGEYIQLTVTDSGTGIAPDILESIFDPYFTTKDPGEGTGMGLAVVHGIVQSYDGKITVNSKLGKGSSFKIYLPRIKKINYESTPEKEDLPLGRERILFVDDEASLAKVNSKILGYLGYQVTAKTSSEEALELFKSKPDDFDLVISDMTMPNMTGDKLAIELIKIRSDIPVIICTGYSKKMTDTAASKIGIKAVAYKPIVKEDLAKIIRNVLDEVKIHE